MNILVPLAGEDESFVTVFNDLKPFVDIKGTSLIEFVLRCLPFRLDKIIFVCLKEHDKKFNIGSRLKRIFGRDVKIILSEKLTEGSACSALLAEELIDNKEDLLIDLADIYYDPLSLELDIENKQNSIKGIIPICRNTILNKPWGYVYFDEYNFVKELREKETHPSCGNATLGLYYFTHGSDFVKYSKFMIRNNIRVKHNNLFYVGPVYNLFVENKGKIITSDTKILHLLGSTMEVLDFIDSNKK